MSPGARFAVFLSVVLGVWLLQHVFVGWRLWSVPLLESPTVRRLLLAWLVIGFVSYPLGRILWRHGSYGSGLVLEWVGSVWMGVLFLLFAFLLAADLVTLGGFALSSWAPTIRGVAVGLALVASVTALVGGLRIPRVVEAEAPIRRLPAELDGLRVVQLSDLHLGTLIGEGTLRRVVARIDGLEPDLVAVTGDLVDGDAAVVERLLPALETLRAPLGVYAVLGNHEHYAGARRSRELLEAAGYRVLDNESVEVAPGLVVAGVPDDRGARQVGALPADLDRALSGVDPDAAVILLQHSPEHEERIAALGVDLLLDGHTHGGQIWPFHYAVATSYPHYGGIYHIGDMTQVVSRGAGRWGPPMRLLAPSDVVLVTLRARL